MKEFQWPYLNVSKEEFLVRIAFAEKILQKYGAEYIGDHNEIGTWTLKDGSNAYEEIEKHIWKRENEYIRVDRIYFSEKPFLVLKFSTKREGPYEDADPFPYDLPDIEFEYEIKYVLGLKTS